METKEQIRKRILAKRDALPQELVQAYGTAIQKNIIQMSGIKEANTVLLYTNYKKEVMTDLLLSYCLEKGKTVGVPRVIGKQMQFFKITGFHDVRPGFHNILEPIGEEVAEPQEAFVIVPGVVFAENGKRIGYGGGYYDRFLAEHRNYKTCAAAYEFQLVDDFENSRYDIPVSRIVTEKRMITAEKTEQDS